MNHLDRKILDLLETFKSLRLVETEKDFCTNIGLLKQNLNGIKNGRNHFTPIHIENICKVYNVNANWIFGTQENTFNKLKRLEKTGTDE